MATGTLGTAKVESDGVITNQTVEKILSIYRPEHRYVGNSVLTGISMRCELRSTIYPYTTKQIFGYITAPTATIFACQLAYVLVGGMVLSNTEHLIVRRVKTWENFLSLRDEALLRFGRFDIRFFEEVENKYPISGYIEIGWTRCIGGTILSLMEFRIGDGIGGKIHAALLEAE